MDLLGGKIAAIAQRALVGGEAHPRAARGQRMGERLRGKEMAAGAAGGDQNEIVRDCCHLGVIHRPLRRIGWSNRTSDCGRLRVTAIRKPMPMPSETSDDPP